MGEQSKTDTFDTIMGLALIGAAIGGVALLKFKSTTASKPAPPKANRPPPQPVIAQPVPAQPVRTTSHNDFWDTYGWGRRGGQGQQWSVQRELNKGHGFPTGQDDPTKTYAPIRHIKDH
jgi:hypothetical protein